MMTAEARIPTERAGRYIAQLCRHLDQIGAMHRGGPGVRNVEWSESAGTIRFGRGVCAMRAVDDSLIVRIEADDEPELRRLQEAIAARLTTIGRRDGLEIRWQPIP